MSQSVTFNGQELFPSRYASGDDLRGKAYTVEIARVVKEKMTDPHTKKETEKHVVYFAGAKRGYVLGKEFAESIASACGEWDAGKWAGKKFVIFPKETRLGIGVRARAVGTNHADAERTPPPEEEEE